MEHPKRIGDLSTLAVIVVLRHAGYDVLIPFGENTRYDLVIDDGMSLARVQCKTGRLRAGAVHFNTCSTYGHHAKGGAARRSYAGEVEYFGVHCQATQGVYLVPIADAATATSCALRITKARNNQAARIRPAERYLVGTAIFAASIEPRATPARAGPGPHAPRRRRD